MLIRLVLSLCLSVFQAFGRIISVINAKYIAVIAMAILWTTDGVSQSHDAASRAQADANAIQDWLSQRFGASYAQNMNKQSSYCSVVVRVVIDQKAHAVMDAWSLVKPSKSFWKKAKSERSISLAISAVRGLELHREIKNLDRNLFIKHFQTMSIRFPGEECNLEQIDHADAVATAIEKEEANFQSLFLVKQQKRKKLEEVDQKRMANLFGDDFDFIETEICSDSEDSKCGKLVASENYQYPVSGFDEITFDKDVDQLSSIVKKECGRAHLWLHNPYPEGFGGEYSYENRHRSSEIRNCYRLFGYVVDVTVGWSVYSNASSQNVRYYVDSPTSIEVRGFQKQDYKSGVRDATMDQKKLLFNDILDSLKKKYPDYLVDKADQQINARYLFAGCSIVLHYRGFHRYTPFDSAEKYLEYLHPIFAKQLCDAVRGKVEKRPKDVTL